MDTYVMTREERAVFALRALYRQYGYSPYKMSKFEEYDLYVRNKNFLISDHVITFTDHTGRLLALKPDVTLSIVKNSRDVPGKINRVYYNENVYRVAPGSHTFREILQVGLECIGEIDDYAVCEVVSLAAKSLEQLSPDYVLEVSHLDIVARVLDGMGVSDETRAALLGCVAEKNAHDIARICAEEGVDADRADMLRRLVTTYGCVGEVLPVLDELAADNDALCGPLCELKRMLDSLPMSTVSEHVHLDFSLINDMNYYNGIVFRGYIKDIPDGILSGGRYDRLMRKMDRRSDAIGFAVYLDLLEGMADVPAEYDVDTVILYDDLIELRVLSAAVASRAQSGERVMAMRSKPAELRTRQIVDLTEKGGAAND